MKVDGREKLPDSLENAKFTSMAWTHDNKGLFYNVSNELGCTPVYTYMYIIQYRQGYVGLCRIMYYIFIYIKNYIQMCSSIKCPYLSHGRVFLQERPTPLEIPIKLKKKKHPWGR